AGACVTHHGKGFLRRCPGDDYLPIPLNRNRISPVILCVEIRLYFAARTEGHIQASVQVVASHCEVKALPGPQRSTGENYLAIALDCHGRGNVNAREICGSFAAVS